jgi:GNAT superfamily N-acetyltransferase
MIRRLGPGDGAVWRDIRLEALATAPEAFSARHDDRAERPLTAFEAQLADRGIFIAEEAGRTLGSACLVADDDAKYTARGWVMSVFVSPSARGKGVARQLLATLIAEARKRGMTALFLDVGKANGAARAVYARAGFVELAAAERPEGSDSGCELTMRLAL